MSELPGQVPNQMHEVSTWQRNKRKIQAGITTLVTLGNFACAGMLKDPPLMTVSAREANQKPIFAAFNPETGEVTTPDLTEEYRRKIDIFLTGFCGSNSEARVKTIRTGSKFSEPAFATETLVECTRLEPHYCGVHKQNVCHYTRGETTVTRISRSGTPLGADVVRGLVFLPEAVVNAVGSIGSAAVLRPPKSESNTSISQEGSNVTTGAVTSGSTSETGPVTSGSTSETGPVTSGSTSETGSVSQEQTNDQRNNQRNDQRNNQRNNQEQQQAQGQLQQQIQRGRGGGHGGDRNREGDGRRRRQGINQRGEVNVYVNPPNLNHRRQNR